MDHIQAVIGETYTTKVSNPTETYYDEITYSTCFSSF